MLCIDMAIYDVRGVTFVIENANFGRDVQIIRNLGQVLRTHHRRQIASNTHV